MSSLRTPAKLLVFTVGVTTLVLTNSSKLGKKIYLRGIVYQRVFNLVLHIVGKDYSVWFHD
jgi:hypothetical protein